MDPRRSVWRARWRRAALASGLLTLALCAVGATQAFVGLEVGETCTLVEGQDLDPEYWAAHRNDVPLPPYSSPCNAGHDMVPRWVNPAIATTAASCATSLAGLVVTRGARGVGRDGNRRAGRSRAVGHQSPSRPAARRPGGPVSE